MAEQAKDPKAKAGRGSIVWRVNAKGERVGYCQVMLGYDDLGNRIRRSVKGTTEREIDREVRKLLNRHESQTLVTRQAEKETVGAYLDRWLKTRKGPITPQAWRRHENNVGLHLRPAIGKLKLDSLRPDHLRALYSQKLEAGLAPRTVKYLHTTIQPGAHTGNARWCAGAKCSDRCSYS